MSRSGASSRTLSGLAASGLCVLHLPASPAGVALEVAIVGSVEGPGATAGVLTAGVVIIPALAAL